MKNARQTRRSLAELVDYCCDLAEAHLERAHSRREGPTAEDGTIFNGLLTIAQHLRAVHDDMEVPRIPYPPRTKLHAMYMNGQNPGALLRAIDAENDE
jgi:hypothetical protein